MSDEFRHEVWIDRGGTFTDFVLFDRVTGAVSTLKIPSSDEAPVAGIQRLFGLDRGAAIPPCDVRLGTTLATNALLEHRGARSALIITRGFADLLSIGDQTRPDLFALHIVRTAPLPEVVLEVDARCDASGGVLERPKQSDLRRELSALRARGIESVGIVVLNDHRRGELEREILAVARAMGFPHVALSSELCPEIGLLARAETTALDAYLTPPLRAALSRLDADLAGCRVRVMQSSGALTAPPLLSGPSALFSGPAGGAVAAARLAGLAGFGSVIGFDMGGTSTDVCRSAGGRLETDAETIVNGYRVRAPTLMVTTIAAGGGSICRFDGHKLTVGPESAGSTPGPLCYGNESARELTISDVNLLLGRLLPARFPFPLERQRAEAKTHALLDETRRSGMPLSFEELLGGFLEIANRAMAEAIREVSVARGHDVREHTLFVLGGAGGQHACAIAKLLGMRTVVFHPLGGVLAAVGLGLSDVGWHGTAELDPELDEEALAVANQKLDGLVTAGLDLVRGQAGPDDAMDVRRRLALCYSGTETALPCDAAPLDELLRAFHERHRETFGYFRPGHRVELVHAAVEVNARRPFPAFVVPSDPPLEERTTRLFAGGRFLDDVPVLTRSALTVGERRTGPLVVVDATGTNVIDPGFSVTLDDAGLLVARADTALSPTALKDRASGARADPVLLEVMGRRFMSLAEQMGRVLQRTALSTNIRERLDFSCAVFDREANLVANAPHIPVHLGAMSESVRAVVALHPEFEPGDVFVTNDPAAGGSHLPDITVVTPAYDRALRLLGFVANRGHHADVGGSSPGSMPPDSRRIEDEGVVFRAFRALHRGTLDEDGLLAILGTEPFPARRPRDNLADLKAQIAAATLGTNLLRELGDELGDDVVTRYMKHLQDDAAARVSAWLRERGPLLGHFEDVLDDGTPIAVTLRAEGAELVVDFSGSGPQHETNANAPRAVTTAAVLYCLRAWLGSPIPLNSGCLRPVRLIIPEPSVLSPKAGAAVAAGNVETSQRIVDVLLAAAQAAAASQGTMNNLCFGDEERAYYETIGGGAGAGPTFHGASAVHTHMTNTRLTDAEVLERRYPVRVRRLAIRRGSGGNGRFRGGDGIVRELEFLDAVRVTLISERRARAPFGLAGGEPGLVGRTFVNEKEQPGRFTLDLGRGDRLRLETPGGGGYGTPG